MDSDSNSDAPEMVSMSKAKEQFKGQVMKTKPIKKVAKAKPISASLKSLISEKINPNIIKQETTPKVAQQQIRSLKIEDKYIENRVNKHVTVKLQRTKTQPIRTSVKDFTQKQFGIHKREPLKRFLNK